MIVRGPDLSVATWSGGALVSSLLLALGVALWELTFGDGAVLPTADVVPVPTDRADAPSSAVEPPRRS